MRGVQLGGVVVVALLGAGSADASERQFTYTHSTSVLGKGDVEIEPWTTFRMGRPTWFFRLDQRVEIELGLGRRVQTSWYLNATTSRQGDGQGGFVSSSAFQGVSWELKGKLSDPVADALGSALYLEVSAGPSEVELEGKVLLDKTWGKVSLAANLVGEAELEFAEDTLDLRGEFEVDLGAAVQVSKAVSVALEVVQRDLVETDAQGRATLAHAALFGGPTIGFRQDRWWGAFSVLPQWARLGGHAEGPLDLEQYENVEARLLFGIHL